MLKLVIEDDEGRKTTVPLVRNEITIGRKDGNTIRLTERNVSRVHAKIMREGEDQLFIEDFSRYGTRKNGRRFNGRTAFGAGDVVTIGDYRLLLESEAAARAAKAGPPGIPAEAKGDELDNMKTVALPKQDAAAAGPVLLPEKHRSRLVCLSEPFSGSDFLINQQEIVLGRGSECDVVIDHPSVSKRHARIVTEEGVPRLEDLESSNGVLVNGVTRSNSELRSGDIVELGSLQFRYVAPGEDFVFIPVDEIDVPEMSVGPTRPGWIIPLLIVLVVGGAIGIYFAVSGSDSDDGPVVVESGNEEPDTSAAAFTEGNRHLNAARWDDAIAAFGRVEEGADDYEAAQALAESARAERDTQAIYNDILRLVEDERFEDAQRRIADIPENSYYRTVMSDENLDRRILNGIIDARVVRAQDLIDTGDSDAARELIEEVLPLAPDDVRLINVLVQIDAREGGPTRNAIDPMQETDPTESDPVEADPDNEEPEDDTETDTYDSVDGPLDDDDDDDEEEVAVAEPDVEPDPVTDPEPTLDFDPVERAEELRIEAARAGVHGNHREAIRLLEEARELTPGNSQLDLMLYRNYDSIGNRNRAAQAIQRYIDARPSDPNRATYEAWLEENAP